MLNFKSFQYKYSNKNWETYFSIDEWDYKIDFYKVDEYYFVSFSARKTDSDEPYSKDIITNSENPYKLMRFIFSIIEDFYYQKIKELEDINKEYKWKFNVNDFIKGFKFSFRGDKIKSYQRLLLYKKCLPKNWKIKKDENNHFIMTPDN